MIRYDFKTYNKLFVQDYSKELTKIKNIFTNPTQMMDWYDVDKCINEEELAKVITTSEYIRENYDVMVVIGIGGSYLGAKAVIDAFAPYFTSTKPEIIFAGNSLSASYHYELIEYLKDKNFIINVVSKSGNTLEPSLTFDLLLNELENKYSENEVKERIIITTDPDTGNLRKLVNENDYKSFSIPTDIGGRFSVLTAAGLLPIAVSGIDVNKLLEGARKCDKEKCYEYANIRHQLYLQGHYLESYTVYEPKLLYFTEWLKQLFAESQGKDYKGIMPISAVNTRDLHSLGQYYQEGSRIIFETVIGVDVTKDLFAKSINKTYDQINNIALESVAKAHAQDKTYSNIISLDTINEKNIGELIYFFELSAAIGGYLLKINPFNQPGVSKYKEIINKELEE